MVATRLGVKDIPCQYFNVKVGCSVCGARPAMHKTGKCAPHSVNPVDPGREDDWIDCYEGCPRHDPIARRRYLERVQRDNNKPGTAQKIPVRVVHNKPVKLPNITRLALMHRHLNADKQLAKLFRSLIESRHLPIREISRQTGYEVSGLERRFRGQYKFGFNEICKILELLQEYDNKRKMEGKQES